MTSGLYAISVPVIERVLSNLDCILDKGREHLKARNLAESVFLDARLYPDMFPLVRQVQTFSDVAKGAIGRLGNADIPKYEDDEKSFDDLKRRLQKTRDFVRSVDRDVIDSSALRPLVITARDRTLNFTGMSYLTGFVLPNLYFHSAMVYAILRHNGVEIGKRDFLGSI